MSDAKASELRLFISIELPQSNRQLLAELLERLKKGVQFTGAHPTWVAAQNLHLTLAFLGNQPPERVAEIEQAMQTAASLVPAFRIRLAGLELFPSAREPRIISIAVRSGLESLAKIHTALTEQLRGFGSEVDNRPFRAHLTLARIKSVKGLAGLRDVVKSHSGYSAREFKADRITLVKSTLAPGGSIYEIVSEAMLPAGANEQ